MIHSGDPVKLTAESTGVVEVVEVVLVSLLHEQTKTEYIIKRTKTDFRIT